MTGLHRFVGASFGTQQQINLGVEEAMVAYTGQKTGRLAQDMPVKAITAPAMHVVRVIAWLWGEPLGERRRKPGHFARLAPHPLSRQAVLCEGDLTQQSHSWQGSLSLRMTLRKGDIGRDLNMQRPSMNCVQFYR